MTSVRVGRTVLDDSFTRVAAPDDESEETRILRAGAISIAGYLAHRRARPGERRHALLGAGGDLARIDPAHLLPAARLAQSILRRRWDDVERVAAALQPGRTLRGQALRRALGGKP